MALTPEQQALDFNPELQDVSRQRKLADLLMAQGLQGQPQGQMISGHYVAPSWAQQLNPMANVLAGQAIGERADTQQQQLAEALRGKQQEVMQAYAQAKTPQEKFAIGTSQYAPAQLKAAMFDKLKSQKVGEGESILDYDLSTGAYNPIATGGMKAAPEIKQAMQMLGINKTVEQLSPQELQAVNNKIVQLKQAGASSVRVDLGQHGFDNALKLRENFKSEPTYKAFTEIQAASNTIQQAAKMQSPAGDLAAANKVFKMLDPSSITRESELGMAMAATGLEDRVKNYANLIISGQKLTPAQREDFVKLSNTMFDVAGKQYNAKRNEYADIAKANNLSVEAAVPPEAKLGQTPTLRWNPQTQRFE